MMKLLVFLLSLVGITVVSGYGPGYGYHSGARKSSSPANPGLPQHHNYYGPVHNHYETGYGSDYHATHGYSGKKDKVWRFMIGDNFGPYEYIDVADGFLKGFHPDLVKAVCAEVGKTCYWMMDKYTNCWDTASGLEIPGTGLASGWYDACVGLFPSPERLNSFNFTQAFSPQFKAALHYKIGEINGDPTDVHGRKIGFINGWAVGKNCLGRQLGIKGALSRSFEAVMFDTHEDMIVSLQSGQVDAILTVNAFPPAKLGLQAIEPWFHCTEDGSALMAPYGSELIDWWNDAFNQFRQNGGYRRLCDVSRKIHGHRGALFCLDDKTFN